MPILKRWREIVLIGIVGISILFLAMLVKNLLAERKEAIMARNVVETAYNNIQSGETSEENLRMTLEEVLLQQEKMEKYIPKALKKQDVILALTDISKGAGIEGFAIENCIITSETSKEVKKYEQIKVQVKKIAGTYEEIKGFLGYIKNYKNKITISNMSFAKAKDTNQFEGNMALVFYGDTEA